MFLLIALSVLVAFLVAIGTVLLISLDRAASLVDHRSIDAVLSRK